MINYRVQNILSLQNSDGLFKVSANNDRLFYHAVDEGLPILALTEYLSVSNSNTTEIKA
jgi:hypothetical protein